MKNEKWNCVRCLYRREKKPTNTKKDCELYYNWPELIFQMEYTMQFANVELGLEQ